MGDDNLFKKASLNIPTLFPLPTHIFVKHVYETPTAPKKNTLSKSLDNEQTIIATVKVSDYSKSGLQ